MPAVYFPDCGHSLPKNKVWLSCKQPSSAPSPKIPSSRDISVNYRIARDTGFDWDFPPNTPPPFFFREKERKETFSDPSIAVEKLSKVIFHGALFF